MRFMYRTLRYDSLCQCWFSDSFIGQTSWYCVVFWHILFCSGLIMLFKVVLNYMKSFHVHVIIWLEAAEQVLRPCWGWGGGGGGVSHVACLNFKTSCVSVYQCFTSLSEIKRKFFVFVRILEKGDSNALWRNHYSSAISELKFCVSNTCTSPFTIKWSTFNILRLTDPINREHRTISTPKNKSE